MERKRKWAAAMVAATLAVAGSTTAYAAQAGYSGQVDSGGAIKYFTNQRTSTQAVSNKLTQGNGGVTQGLYQCTNFSSFPGISDRNFTAGGATLSYGSTSSGLCFRIKMSRTNPADTNGILPGAGTTDVAGTLYY